jgi:hypothetical protein
MDQHQKANNKVGETANFLKFYKWVNSKRQQMKRFKIKK